LQEGAEYEHIIPKGWNSIVLCYEGKLDIQEDNNKKLEAG
jgi:hypothetical protein